VQRTGLWTQREHKPKKCSQTDACTRPVGCQLREQSTTGWLSWRDCIHLVRIYDGFMTLYSSASI
jgi:hypothetical protein